MIFTSFSNSLFYFFFSGPPGSLWEDNPTCVGELLTWLGAGRSPTTTCNRWLPLGNVGN
jgi:hypothetical protein